MPTSNQFVVDGESRHRDVIAPAIEATVRADYAEKLVGASLLKRVQLRWAMRREIRRRLDQAVSPRALY